MESSVRSMSHHLAKLKLIPPKIHTVQPSHHISTEPGEECKKHCQTDRSRSQFRPRCFFKIILSDTTPQSRLIIPGKFTRTCGYDLADQIFLQTPPRSVWKVELERTSGVARLGKGWPEFAAYHSLTHGHLLVFRYEGNSTFHVKIMDKSATEIAYPNTHQNEQANGNTKTGIAYNAHRNQHVRGKSPKRPASNAEKARAIASAYAYKSNKPSYFIKIMKPSHIGKTGVLRVNKNDMSSYVRAEGDMVILQVGRRLWVVKCSLYNNRYRMGAGWKEFREDNALAVDDALIFELIDKSRKLVNVVIYRAVDS